MLTHPTLDQLRALKLDGMAQAFVELEAQEEVRNLTHAERLGAAARSRGCQPQHPALPDLIAGGSVATQPSRHRGTSITARRGGLTKHCSSSWRRAAGSLSAAD